MAIKGGQIIHAGNGNVIFDRVQTGGPGQLNIPTEKIYELGNYQSVATTRDTPDLSFSMESFDVSCEMEEFLTGGDAGSAEGIDLATAKPVDIASQIKHGRDQDDPFNVITSISAPFLYLETMEYRFGLRDNATQTATLRGDSIFYSPGATFVETTVGTGAAGQVVVTAQPAYAVAEGVERRVINVTVGTERQVYGYDYTEDEGAVNGGAAVATLTFVDAIPVGRIIRIVYASPTATTYPQSVHPDTLVKPAAVKGKDVEVYLGDYDPADREGSAQYKLPSVQSITVTYRVTLDRDEEFGNHQIVAQDFDTPTVGGSFDVKPRNPDEFQELIRRLQDESRPNVVLGPTGSSPLPLHIVVLHPETGDPIKRFFIEDARASMPGFQGRVQQKTTVSIPFESDEGNLRIFEA